MSHAAIDYSRYQTLAITRRGVNGAVIDIQMKAAKRQAAHRRP
jgi:hypothetical protein